MILVAGGTRVLTHETNRKSSVGRGDQVRAARLDERKRETEIDELHARLKATGAA